MTFSSKDLVSRFSDLVVEIHGKHTEFDHVAGFESASATSLVFIQDIEHAPTTAAVVIASDTVFEQLMTNSSAFLIKVTDARLAQAKIKQFYHDYQSDDAEWNPIHDSAVIHKSARLGNGCRVGPNAVIGADCQIADHAVVRANSVIEHNVVIGEYSIINCNANIGYGTVIGKNVTVQAGCVIGSEGYGFAPDQNQRYHRIPHTGNVVLEDDVHVGANSCIDRGTYGSTIIARGVKIDNLVHIAHNVQVGEDSLLTAQTVIAGSSTIGKRVIASGQTGILDHKTVPDDTILVQRAGVSESLPHGGMWAGSPAKPFKEWVRTQALSKKVARLETQLKELQKHLNQD